MAADGKGAPPVELTILQMCDRWQIPPGQLMDEDYQLIRRMITVDAVDRAVRRGRAAKGTAIHDLTGWERKLLFEILRPAGLY